MDDTAIREFLTRPANTYQRQYEALRAIFVDDRSQRDVAEEFGFTPGSLRQLTHALRRFCEGRTDATESPFFGTWKSDALSSLRRNHRPSLRSPIDANGSSRFTTP